MIFFAITYFELQIFAKVTPKRFGGKLFKRILPSVSGFICTPAELSNTMIGEGLMNKSLFFLWQVAFLIFFAGCDQPGGTIVPIKKGTTFAGKPGNFNGSWGGTGF